MVMRSIVTWGGKFIPKLFTNNSNKEIYVFFYVLVSTCAHKGAKTQMTTRIFCFKTFFRVPAPRHPKDVNRDQEGPKRNRKDIIKVPKG